jgi:hypothetical protein
MEIRVGGFEHNDRVISIYTKLYIHTYIHIYIHMRMHCAVGGFKQDQRNKRCLLYFTQVLFVCVYVWCVCIYTCIHTQIHTHTYTLLCACEGVLMHVCACATMCSCVCVCVCVCVFLFMYRHACRSVSVLCVLQKLPKHTRTHIYTHTYSDL